MPSAGTSWARLSRRMKDGNSSSASQTDSVIPDCKEHARCSAPSDWAPRNGGQCVLPATSGPRVTRAGACSLQVDPANYRMVLRVSRDCWVSWFRTGAVVVFPRTWQAARTRARGTSRAAGRRSWIVSSLFRRLRSTIAGGADGPGREVQVRRAGRAGTGLPAAGRQIAVRQPLLAGWPTSKVASTPPSLSRLARSRSSGSTPAPSPPGPRSGEPTS